MGKKIHPTHENEDEEEEEDDDDELDLEGNFPQKNKITTQVDREHAQSSASLVKTKEINLLLESIANKLQESRNYSIWETRKALCALLGFVSAMFATFLVFYGLRVTVLFEGNPENIGIAFFGFVLYIISVAVCFYLGCPPQSERLRRKEIETLALARANDSYMDKMVKDASHRAKPPELTVKVIAIIRGSSAGFRETLTLNGTTLQRFCDDVEKSMGLPKSQQIIKLNGRVLSDMKLHFIHDLKFVRGQELYVYNRGKYNTLLEDRKTRKSTVLSSPSKMAARGQFNDNDSAADAGSVDGYGGGSLDDGGSVGSMESSIAGTGFLGSVISFGSSFSPSKQRNGQGNQFEGSVGGQTASTVKTGMTPASGNKVAWNV